MVMFRNIRNFLFYKSILDKNRDELLKSYGIKIDMIYRMYTVYTVDETEYLQYGEQLVDANYKAYKKNLDNFLIKLGLMELYGISMEDRVNARQYALGLRFKSIDTLFWANLFAIAFTSLFVGLGIGIILSLIF